METHNEYNNRRRGYLDELAALSPLERLRSVTANVAWRLGAIPGGYADAGTAAKLSVEEQQSLLARLERAPRGPWSRLRADLEALTDSTPPQS